MGTLYYYCIISLLKQHTDNQYFIIILYVILYSSIPLTITVVYLIMAELICYYIYMHRSDRYRLQGKIYSSKHFRNGSVFVVQVFLSGRLLYALFRISKSSIVVGSDDSEGGGRW